MIETNTKTPIDKETVEFLRKSKEIVGYLRPCVRDQTGKLVAGKHRKEADSNWPEVVKHVKDDLDRELVGLHDNIQRRVPIEETKERLIRIAELLVKRGVQPKNVAKEMVKLVPYSESWVYSLLPEDFKIKQLRVNTQVVHHIHENVKGLSRVEASRVLAKYLRIMGPNVKPGEKVVEALDSVNKPILPYPDCLCAKCPHYKECRFLGG